MGHKFHRGFTVAEKAELWDRWKRGESLKAIGRAFGKQSSSIYFLVAPHGGIRPAERRRSRLALTLVERLRALGRNLALFRTGIPPDRIPDRIRMTSLWVFIIGNAASDPDRADAHVTKIDMPAFLSGVGGSAAREFGHRP